MNLGKICMRCMEDKGTTRKCPYCGHKEGSPVESLLHLPPGTVLHDKYLLGRALGQGGFGITYIAMDTNLGIKLAVKEYLPQELATRISGHSMVSAYKTSLADQFNYGLEKFLEEARTLARFIAHPNVIEVRDYFEANGTAYLVMSYVEGVTLQEHLRSSGGKITVDEALNIFNPVLDALQEIHSKGILHRDISPDNLLVDRKGRVILIDFGSARQAMGERSKSLSVIMKAGYSPVEQYQSKGKQGPWTDIYAVAASFYRCITGTMPPESIERITEDLMAPPSQLGVVIEAGTEEALLKALAVKSVHRFREVKEFQEQLLSKEPMHREAASPGPEMIQPTPAAHDQKIIDEGLQEKTKLQKIHDFTGSCLNTVRLYHQHRIEKAERESKQFKALKLSSVILLSIMMVLTGWFYLTGLSAERTMLNRTYYQNLAHETGFIAEAHQELKGALSSLVVEVVTSELEREAEVELTAEEREIIHGGLDLITLAMAEVFYEEWLEDHFLLITDDVLDLLNGEKQDLTSVINISEGKDRMEEKLIASLEILPADLRDKLNIPVAHVELIVDRFMGEIAFPEEFQLAYLMERGGDSVSEDVEIVVSNLQNVRRLYRYLPPVFFPIFLLLFILLAGPAGGLKWFGATALFISSTFFVGIRLVQSVFIPVLFSGNEVDLTLSPGLILNLEPGPVLFIVADYTVSSILIILLLSMLVGAVFLIAGFAGEKMLWKAGSEQPANEKMVED